MKYKVKITGNGLSQVFRKNLSQKAALAIAGALTCGSVIGTVKDESNNIITAENDDTREVKNKGEKDTVPWLRTTNAAFCRRLCLFREERGISQQELAERVGCTQAQISRYEHGTQDMAMSRFFEICRELHTAPSIFFIIS